MPWDVGEFERNRLEKGRKLLEESEEHRGSRDLQLYVEGMDLTVQLHCIFLDDNGRRQGLTGKEKQQGLIVLMRIALCQLSSVFSMKIMDNECFQSIKEAEDELRGSPLGALIATLAAAGFSSLRATDTPTTALQAIVTSIAEMLCDTDFSVLSAALELHQRSSGFDPLLSAADMRLLMLYSQQESAGELLKRQPEGPVAQQWLAAVLSANRQLLQLDPSAAACLHFKRGALVAACNRRLETVAAYRSALLEAPQHKSFTAELMAAQQLADALIVGFGGRRWSLEEVTGLVRTAKTALAKCKPWVPRDLYAEYKSLIGGTAQPVEVLSARRPGAAMLPALQGPSQAQPIGDVDVAECSGCGKTFSSLKKCANCQVAAYCTRACQVQHWKRGGHKQECARLAAGSSGGAGGSSRS